MGISPFFANKGYHSQLSIHPECNVASARVCEYAVDLADLHEFPKDTSAMLKHVTKKPLTLTDSPHLTTK